MVRKLHNDLEAAHAQNRRDREALADLQAFTVEIRRSADPALIEELELVREDLTEEKKARRRLEDNLAADQAEFNAKREELERDVAELEIGKRHVTEENESFRVKFNEEAARREDAVKNLKHRLALAEEDTKHFQVLVDETEKKLGTSQGELAAAWAELTALRDIVKIAGAQSTSSDSQLAELRGELARERQARVMAVESEQARTSVVEAHLDEQRHTYDAQMKSAERKADAAMKTAQKDRQLLAQARDERDVAERIAADLRVEKDGLERAGVDLREQLKFLRETVGHQKETIESLRLQTPQVIPRPPTMVAIGR